MARSQRDVTCPICRRLLYRAVGNGTEVEIACKCKRVIAFAGDGTVLAVRQEVERRVVAR